MDIFSMTCKLIIIVFLGCFLKDQRQTYCDKFEIFLLGAEAKYLRICNDISVGTSSEKFLI